VYISFEPLELRKIFCRDDGTKGVCKLDDLSPYGYNFSICRKELITPLYCSKFTQSPNLFENCSMLGNLLLKKTKTKIGQTFLPIQFG
jgi:hypothetical protein